MRSQDERQNRKQLQRKNKRKQHQQQRRRRRGALGADNLVRHRADDGHRDSVKHKQVSTRAAVVKTAKRHHRRPRVIETGSRGAPRQQRGHHRRPGPNDDGHDRLMGNERSALSGLEIEEKAIEITDFWLQHSASIHGTNPQSLAVFVSEPSLHSTASFGKPSPLERAAKNLMLHRHPCILKYISSWRRGSAFYLATEDAKPLAQVIGSQTTLQICIGLHSILRALIFLHEKALASHNNVCSSAVYVTPEGSWKLGGLEYLCRFSDFNQTYLQKIKNYRYEKALAPEEDSAVSDSPVNPVAIDQYAFGVLTEEVLRLKNADDVPALADFREMCRKYLRNSDPVLRTKLSATLQHPFFTHDFINIHAFLMELPLKTESEKEHFFSSLVQQLKAFPEKIVAEQLGRLLLSRMVLLDFTAQKKLLPFVLKPKGEDKESSDSSGLFTIPTFKSCLVPKLLQMFCVRDVSIRLLLLSHLNSYIYAFQMDELKSQILPELLVGIKDHDDQLVSTTLRALADLVPILGAATVIGGNRGKLFTDGRPNHNPNRRELSAATTTQHKVVNDEIRIIPESSSVVSVVLELPERPSPDGGEDKTESAVTYAEEENTWSDWETQELALPNGNVENLDSILVENEIEIELNDSRLASVDLSLPVDRANSQSSLVNDDKTKYKKKLVISDISELDIKHSKSMQSTREEIDFFTDMEPVIEKPRVLHIDEASGRSSKSVFDVETVAGSAGNDEDDDGWADDLNDWGSDGVVDAKL